MQEKSSRLEEMKVTVVLRAARAALGISQAELALQLGVSQSAIARCERGTGTIPANTMLRAVKFFSDQGIDITGILEENPALILGEELFVRAYNAEVDKQRQLARSAMKKRFGKLGSDDAGSHTK